MQESSGLNADWFGETRLCSSKNISIPLKISLSKIFPQIGSNETVR